MIVDSRRRSSSSKWMLLLCLLWMQSVNAIDVSGDFFYRCGLFGTPRCFLSLGYVMHTGEPDSADCEERCVFFPILQGNGVQCGVCTPELAPFPSVSPAPTGSAAPSPAPSPFQITLDLQMPAQDEFYYTNGAKRWSEVITTGLPDIPSSQVSVAPRDPACNYPTTIDDLYLCVYEDFIDGPGNTAGFAGYTYTRTTGDRLPAIGYMRFEPDDVEQGKSRGWFQNLVIHEIGHTLGVGTNWDCPGTSVFNSPKANAEYQAISGCTNPAPTESDCIHWLKSCFQSEVMTGTVSSRSKLSRVTIGALDDMGYQVDYSSADTFTGNDLSSDPSCNCNRRLEHDETTRVQVGDEPWHRGLSEEGRQAAVANGLAFLTEMRLTGAQEKDEDKSESELVYTGDAFVFVYYIEGDEVYSVYVDREMEL